MMFTRTGVERKLTSKSTVLCNVLKVQQLGLASWNLDRVNQKVISKLSSSLADAIDLQQSPYT